MVVAIEMRQHQAENLDSDAALAAPHYGVFAHASQLIVFNGRVHVIGPPVPTTWTATIRFAFQNNEGKPDILGRLCREIWKRIQNVGSSSRAHLPDEAPRRGRGRPAFALPANGPAFLRRKSCGLCGKLRGRFNRRPNFEASDHPWRKSHRRPVRAQQYGSLASTFHIVCCAGMTGMRRFGLDEALH
jgi:hypothetical protein